MIEKEKIKFSLIIGDLLDSEKKKLSELIRKENSQSILAKQSENIIFDYLDVVIKSNYLKLFCLRYNNEIIAYAITSIKPKYLISEFQNLKVKIFFSLLLDLKITTLLNIMFSILNIDLILLNKQNLIKVRENLNLNLIAVDSKYQSKGVGSLFIQKIKSHYKELEGTKYMICETYDQRAIKFYLDKCGFKLIGKKLRIPKNLHILEYEFE